MKKSKWQYCYLTVTWAVKMCRLDYLNMRIESPLPRQTQISFAPPPPGKKILVPRMIFAFYMPLNPKRCFPIENNSQVKHEKKRKLKFLIPAEHDLHPSPQVCCSSLGHFGCLHSQWLQNIVYTPSTSSLMHTLLLLSSIWSHWSTGFCSHSK